MKVHVIDNFYADPMAEREKALASDFKLVDHNGLSYSGIAETQDEATFERLQTILGVDAPKEKTCFYRRYLPSAKQETYIHNDCMIGTFSAVCFLTLPEHCKGGLAFWRHKLLNWTYQPTQAECDAYGLKDNDIWFQRVHQDGFNEELWEMVEYVPMYFNRMVIFYSPAFHSRYPKQEIGETNETCRLIKTFFYKL